MSHSTQHRGWRLRGLSTWEPNTPYTPANGDSIAVSREEHNVYSSNLDFIHDFLNDTVEDEIRKRKHYRSTEIVRTPMNLLGLRVVQKNLKRYDFGAG